MFCYQCEQTRQTEQGAGCLTKRGACGKDATVSDLQDVLIHQITGIAQYRRLMAALGRTDAKADSFVAYGLFTTLTNVNFDRDRFLALIAQATAMRDRRRVIYEEAARAAGTEAERPAGAAQFVAAATLPRLLEQAKTIGVRAGEDELGADVIGLRALLLFGVKGVAAYAHHAEDLGETREAVAAGIAQALDVLAGNERDLETLLAEALALGRTNLAAMEALDTGNTGTYGTPVPTPVRISPVAGKAILVSGHDFRDLAAILEATKDKGINVYTHGEMLPAHGYPKLHAYPHLVGNYGTAWQEQQEEFAAFPGPIVMTSNCLIAPRLSYENRIFTAGPVGWEGIPHIGDGDFSRVVEMALAMPGFTETAPEKTVMAGFGRDAVLGVADKVIDAVKAGAIKHFFLIGGCDGAKPGRNYYTEFAEATPPDSMILTLGCGKYRFYAHDFGTVAGLPRLLDLGQCNDAYSALLIAQALAGAFGCGVNELPLSLIVSWFEQKAAAVLLTLLALGVRNIRLGPTIPGFLTPTLVGVLQQRFNLLTNGSAEADVAASMASRAA
ncbi:hydroxylamine reductase [Xanthobacteraceae bacterium Astr-EGSB]|uniref:hydroxylamine reductase n=1 Tax=Astrobacterium formosum TaxID=3069710 RepID=UPI0027B5D872|nr:hydroxylamine reductase [Xanthobacteraceae bacterium Astr-EGSB]